MGLLSTVLRYAVAAVGTLAILATLLSLLVERVWWLQVLDFWRFQLLIGHALVLAAVAGLLVWGGRQHRPARRWLLAGSAAGMALQLYFLLSYAPFMPRHVPDATPAEAADPTTRLRLLEVNVYMKNREAGRLLDLVRQVRPDVLLALETDAWWVQALRPLQAQYPYRVELPLDNTYGLVLYSRLPLLEPQVMYLQQPRVPSVRTGLRLPGGQVVTLFGVHPSPPFPDNHPNSVGHREVALKKVGQQVQQLAGPALVLGDFNDVSWSFTTRMFEAAGQLRNVRLGRGLFNSYHAHWLPVRWPLDHLFVTREFRLVELQRLPGIGSDHFPLYAELVLAQK